MILVRRNAPEEACLAAATRIAGVAYRGRGDFACRDRGAANMLAQHLDGTLPREASADERVATFIAACTMTGWLR